MKCVRHCLIHAATLLSVTFSPLTDALADSKAAAVAVDQCIQTAIERLDDRISSADVIARGVVMSFCDKAISNYVDETTPPQGVQRIVAKEAMQKGLANVTIERVLASRTGSMQRPSKTNTNNSVSLSPGRAFQGDIVRFFHERPSAIPGRFYDLTDSDGGQLIIMVGDIPGFERKIISISQKYSFTTRDACLSKYQQRVDSYGHKYNIERKPNALAKKDYDLEGAQSYSNIFSAEEDVTGMLACSKENNVYTAEIRFGYKKAYLEQDTKDWMRAVDEAHKTSGK